MIRMEKHRSCAKITVTVSSVNHMCSLLRLIFSLSFNENLPKQWAWKKVIFNSELERGWYFACTVHPYITSPSPLLRCVKTHMFPSWFTSILAVFDRIRIPSLFAYIPVLFVPASSALTYIITLFARIPSVCALYPGFYTTLPVSHLYGPISWLCVPASPGYLPI